MFGAALDFPKYYEKSALLAKKRKFPKTYHELQLIREEIRNFREMYCVRTTAVSRRVRDAASSCFTRRAKLRLATGPVHRGRSILTWTRPRGSAVGRFGRMTKIHQPARSDA